MWKSLTRGLAGLWILGVLGAPSTGIAEIVECDPIYDPTITAPGTAIPGWPDRNATTAEIESYVLGIAAETDRVVTLPFSTSANGTTLYYSLVGDAATLAAADAIAASQEELRDPRVTDTARAGEIAATERAIFWYLGSVHGQESSGADAALGILYELAARTDCEAVAIRAELLMGVIALQNPDGRDAVTYENAYGINLGRDWFAETQPETRDKLEVLVRYPPVALVDAHELSGTNFWFPPAGDPVHHEISPQSLEWANVLFNEALEQLFAEGRLSQPGDWTTIEYFGDLLPPVYADSAVSLAFNAAGMVHEAGFGDPAGQRFLEHFSAGWTTLRTTAGSREQILQQFYEAHVEALAEGAAGALAPNAVHAPASPPPTPVPDITVRHYFVATERGSADADRLVARLRHHGVEVYRLTDSVRVRDLRSYGGLGKKGKKLRAGTYWIPMAQPQKRWVQTLLGEDGYPAVATFYDVSAWSNPLLMNLDAWYTGDEAPELASVAELVEDPAPPVPLAPAAFHWFAGDTARAVGAALALAGDGLDVRRLPKKKKAKGQKLPAGAFVAIGDPSRISTLIADFGITALGGEGKVPGNPFVVPKVAVADIQMESQHHVRFFLDHVLRLPWTALSASDVESGLLTSDGYDVFVLPGVLTIPFEAARTQIESWIAGGGVYVGTARGDTGGTPFAVASGWTSATASQPAELDVPGTLFPVKLKKKSPLALGAGKRAWWFHLGEQVLSPSKSGVNAGLFPKKEKKLWYSGYAEGAEALLKSAALIDERLGEGRVVLFSGEPNFRAWTDGTQLLLSNALVYPRDPAARARGLDVRSLELAGDVARARASLGPPTGPGRPLRIRVAVEDEGAALSVLARFTSDVSVHPSGATVAFEIPNPEGLPPDAHPFSRMLLPALAEAGVDVLYAAL